MTCGLPQGSILGPLLFNLYMLLLSQKISKQQNTYSDDTQIDISTIHHMTIVTAAADTRPVCLTLFSVLVVRMLSPLDSDAHPSSSLAF